MEKQLFLRPSDRGYELPYVSRSVFPKLMVGGFVGTLAMTLFIYLSPLVGLPNVDLAGILGSFLVGRSPVMFSGGWWLGMGWHFINGSVLFPFMYAYWIYPVFSEDNSSVTVNHGFRRNSVGRGALWSVMLWAFCQCLAMPLAGGGFFSNRTLEPYMVLIGSFLAHLVYGVIFGALTRARDERAIELRENRAA